MSEARAAAMEYDPDTPIEHLPTGWVIATLDSVTEPVEKVRPAEILGDSFDYLDLGAISNDTNQVIGVKTVKSYAAPSRARQLVRAHDILFSCVRVYLKNIAMVPDRFDRQVASTAFAVIRANEFTLPKFLFHYLLWQKTINSLSELQRGNSPPAVLEKDVRGYSIPIPPLAEQKRIVSKIDELFSEIEAGERALKRARAALARYRKSVLKAAVTGDLTADWRAANKERLEPADKLLTRILAARREAWEKSERAKLEGQGKSPKGEEWKKRYKEPEPPSGERTFDLPSLWILATIDMLCPDDTANGISVAGSLEPPGVPALRLDAITDEGFDYTKRRYIQISEEKAAAMAVREGHLYVSRANGTKSLMGRAILASRPPALIVYPDTIIRFGIIDGFAVWLSAIWASYVVREFLEARAKTSAGIWKIAQSDIKPMPVPIPTDEERIEIISRVAEAFSKADHVEAALDEQERAARALKQSILKAAFEGRLVPKTPPTNPLQNCLSVSGIPNQQSVQDNK